MSGGRDGTAQWAQELQASHRASHSVSLAMRVLQDRGQWRSDEFRRDESLLQMLQAKASSFRRYKWAHSLEVHDVLDQQE